MKTSIASTELLAILDKQMAGLIEEIHEDSAQKSDEGQPDGEWTLINDDTPAEDLPPLINHGNPVVRILVKHRLAGRSVACQECFDEISELLSKSRYTNDDRYSALLPRGGLYTLSKIYENLKEENRRQISRCWAHDLFQD